MDSDEKQHKAAKVTKPIELKPKSMGSPGLRRAEVRSSGEAPEHLPGQEVRGLAGVSILPVSRRRKTAPKPEIVEQIGHRLASVYNAVLSQPIPDRFLDLLSKLEAGEHDVPQGEVAAKKERK
jgi:hypothetical protein